jgi:hypothetical protein
MIHQNNVTFRTIDGADIVELRYPDGNVGAFPVDQINPEDGKRWCDTYAEKYGAFKRDPDSDRKAQLAREIGERQAELDAMPKAAKPAPRFSEVDEDDEPEAKTAKKKHK